MKKIITLIGLIIISYKGHSQILISLLFGDKLNSDKLEFGMDGGLNVSTIQGMNASNYTGRFNLGFYFDVKLKNPKWMFHTGLIVKSTMGSKGIPVYDIGNPDLNTAFVGGSVDRRLSYFNVPVLIKRQFENRFYIEAGPMLGLMTQSIDKFTNNVNFEEDLSYKVKVRDQYHPLDAGVLIGLGSRLMKGKGMNIGIRYYYGLVDIMIDDTKPNQFNRSLYFTVGIPIGKKASEQ
jgi:hypothetical protein